MIIREVEIADAPSLLDLMIQLDHETKFMMLEPGERTTTLEQQVQIIRSFRETVSKSMFILSEDSSIYGFVVGVGKTAQRNKHTLACIIGLTQAVSGQGYGKQLLAKLESWAKVNQFTRIELTVMCHNERAHRLYLSSGYEVEGIKRRSLFIDDQYVNEYYMSKLLN